MAYNLKHVKFWNFFFICMLLLFAFNVLAKQTLDLKDLLDYANLRARIIDYENIYKNTVMMMIVVLKYLLFLFFLDLFEMQICLEFPKKKKILEFFGDMMSGRLFKEYFNKQNFFLGCLGVGFLIWS